ncbi:MAG: hypothetical protein DYG94_02250 [Leptolyngbya sp. PLA3]|nr:MAG: hypothetical protein EDM82_02305 [Cyanobacteria bacterium CYA]MCE7967552.1 hypothetical protein [Leptolyngbya sp. PL-A3]
MPFLLRGGDLLDAGVTGLMAAMPDELEAALGLIDGPPVRVEHGKRVCHLGQIAHERRRGGRCTGSIAAALACAEGAARADRQRRTVHPFGHGRRSRGSGVSRLPASDPRDHGARVDAPSLRSDERLRSVVRAER